MMNLPSVRCEDGKPLEFEAPSSEAAVWRRSLAVPRTARGVFIPASLNGEVLIKIDGSEGAVSVESGHGAKEHFLSAPDEYFVVNVDSADFLSILRICFGENELIFEFRRLRNQNDLEAVDERIREIAQALVATRLQTLDTLRKLQPRLLKVPELG